jgi:hypothetical protein
MTGIHHKATKHTKEIHVEPAEAQIKFVMVRRRAGRPVCAALKILLMRYASLLERNGVIRAQTRA